MMLAQNRCLLRSMLIGGDDERNSLQLPGGRREIRHQFRHSARHRHLVRQQPIDPVGDHPRLVELALRDLFRAVQIVRRTVTLFPILVTKSGKRAAQGTSRSGFCLRGVVLASFSARCFEAKLAALAAFARRIGRGEGERVLSRKRVFRLRGIASVAFAAAIPFICAHAVAGSYEQPPSFSAEQVLPPNLLSSPNYTIANQVGLDNFQYVFSVDTRWGSFAVKGLDLMRVRAREMAATAALEQINTAGTMVNAAGRTALKPLATAKDLVTAPGRTIGDTMRGVGNFFGSVDASMAATDPHKEGVVASVTGGATARRKLAYDFGVDPNTTFPPLHDELTRLATANAIGETGTNAGLAFVTGGAGIAISVGGTSRTLRLALLNKTAAQLEKEGRLSLAAMGVPGPTVDAFYANPHLSPTDRAVVVAERSE